jgi:predicted RNA-binding Zn ribbon-like protein
MTVTLGRATITSQQSFDSYFDDFLGLALLLVNELATDQAYGHPHRATSSPAEQLTVVRAALAAYDSVHTGPMGPGDAAELTDAVHKLRSAIDACVSGEEIVAARVLNDLLTSYSAVPNLHASPGKPLVLTFHAIGDSPVKSHIGDMAASLAIIMGTGRAGRLGRCTAQACERVFYDDTRNGSRRFCSLACQNRAKAASYRARKASRPAQD